MTALVDHRPDNPNASRVGIHAICRRSLLYSKMICARAPSALLGSSCLVGVTGSRRFEFCRGTLRSGDSVAGTGFEPATSGYRTSRRRTCYRSSILG
jgi:hypothetical protein